VTKNEAETAVSQPHHFKPQRLYEKKGFCIMKFNDTLKTVLLAAINCKNNVALIGEPGIGKSSFMEDFAANNLCTKCFTLACNQLADKADLTGARLVPYTLPDGTTAYKTMFYPHQVIADAIDYAQEHKNETPILFLDEINRTTADVTSAALSLTTLRQIGSQKLPDNLIITVAGNDKGNVSSLDEASISRFIKINVEPDADTFLKLDSTLNPYIQKVLAKKPELIFCKSLDTTVTSNNEDEEDEKLSIDDIITDGEGMKQITTPRTIASLSVFLNTLSSTDMMQMLVTPACVEGIENSNEFTEIVVGFVGYTNFTVELIDAIQTDVANNSVASNTVVPDKPACFDELRTKAGTDMVTLQNYINSLPEAMRSKALVYAIYDTNDNRLLIKLLAENMQKLEQTDMVTFVKCNSSGVFTRNNGFGKSNFETFTDETMLGQSFAAIGIL